MKKLVCPMACLALLPLILAAQPKNDYIWLFGYPNDVQPPIPYYGGTVLDFHEAPVGVSWFDIPFDFHSHVVMSNGEGELLFYSNGCQVRNWMHQLVENGDSLNFGTEYPDRCPDHGYPGAGSAVALPWPGSETDYCMFHTKRDDEDTSLDGEFLYTTIRFEDSADSGLVLEKNQLLLDDNFTDQVAAVRHGNGRDWWVIIPRRSSNRHFVFLFGPNGPQLIHEEDVGLVWDFVDYVGQTAFSPDGSKYARISALNGVNVFDFDRCTGTLSDPVHISFEQDTVVNATATGVSISPSNRFLYVSLSAKVLQYDLWATDVAASRTQVAYWDGYMTLGVIPTLFYQQLLAPDGRIYIVPPGSCGHLHVIHQPDEPGLDCDLRQHDLELAALELWGMPNFPHFRIYDLPGSPCDTLGIDAPLTAVGERLGLEEASILVFPNPARRFLTIKLSPHQALPTAVAIIDGLGRTVFEKLCQNVSDQLDLELPNLTPGVYWLRVAMQNGGYQWAKFVVVQE